MSARAADLSVKADRGCGCKGGGGPKAYDPRDGCDGGCSGECSGNGTSESECSSQCCELECLVRPNFFCGQLLTDADLTAVIDWTRKRFALSRYKDGWGIVCGLDLQCGPPARASIPCCGETSTSKGPFVWLSPGYAIDCCGNDLVVCDPLKIDLSSTCRPPYDPCDPNVKPVLERPQRPDVATRREGRLDPCFTADTTDLFAVRVNLRYQEHLMQGQRAMFRGGGACADTTACEYARVRERPCVHFECVPLPIEDDEEPNEIEEWLKEAERRVKQVLFEVVEAVKQGPDAVLKYLRVHPPYQACYLKELVCCLREHDPKSFALASMVRLAGLLLLDRVAGEVLLCNCFDCKPDDGVPLGVVVLRRSTAAGRTTCTVYKIDPRERYRRYLRREICQRLHEGTLDLTKYVGQPLARVAYQLRAAGVTVDTQRPSGPGTLDEFASIVNAHVFDIDPASRRALRPHIVVDPLGTVRVIGFVAK